MTRTTLLVAALASVLACGPEITDDEPQPIGQLELDYGYWATYGDGWETGEWYRSGRRIQLFPEHNPSLEPMCGILTVEAHDRLEQTIAALDPSVDYDLPPGETCGWSEGPGSRVHLEGFTHSPFSCSWLCCRDELQWIANIYVLAANELSDDPIEVHDQPFPAIEAPCD